jgi:hypothetical protein
VIEAIRHRRIGIVAGVESLEQDAVEFARWART